jgi:hypothetical protein
LPFTPPTPDEVRALRVAGDYLVRAGAEAARQLLNGTLDGEAEWLATVSDSLHAGAILCAELIECPDKQIRM